MPEHGLLRLLNNNEPQYPEGLALHPEAGNFSTHLFRETLIFSDDERKTNPPLKENAKNQSCVKDLTVTIQNRESLKFCRSNGFLSILLQTGISIVLYTFTTN